jgi:sugar/nucleoside kinase (ribokinase family)
VSLAAIGNLSLDVVAGAPPRPGGGAFYAARAFAHLGVDARVAVACARADRPRLAAFALPVSWYEAETTTAYTFHYEGDRRIMRQEAVGDPWPPAQALGAVGDATWVHVCALVRTDFPPETLEAISPGRRLLLDAQGVVRTAALGPLRLDAQIGDVLRHVTILKLDSEEAETLSGSADPAALRTLGVPEVLLTLGSKGAFVVASGAVERVPAVEVARPVDPTGAGDTFAAVYLSRRAAGAKPVEAARSAAETTAELLLPA